MSDTLFDLTPAALVYRNPCGIPMFKMRCRECHKTGAINGGGSDLTYSYAICQTCFHDRGDVGDRARRSTHGRELVVIEPEAAS